MEPPAVKLVEQVVSIYFLPLEAKAAYQLAVLLLMVSAGMVVPVAEETAVLAGAERTEYPLLKQEERVSEYMTIDTL